MNNKKTFFIYQLHIFNLPLVFILNFFGDVKVYKFKGWCTRYLHQTKIQSINDFLDVDQWRKTKEQAFQNLKSNLQEKSPISLKTSINQMPVDFTNIFLQTFVKEYEQYLFFITLANNYEGKKYLLNYLFSDYLHTHYPHLKNRNTNFLPFAFLDKLSFLNDSFILFLKSMVKMFRPQPTINLDKNFKYLWTGISPVEYPVKEGKLDFSWPVLNKITTAEDSLFLLEVAPSESCKKYLNSHNIQYALRSQMLSSLPIVNKASIVIKQLFYFIFYIFRVNFQTNFLFSSTLQTRSWAYIFKKINPSFYIYSFSAGWPELPEAAICHSLKIKSVCWFYGTSEFGYTNRFSDFCDDNVRFSIRESDETWVWNNLIKKLIEKRNLVKTSNQIHVIGSILNGNLDVISSPPKPKDQFFKIAIFDITPMKPHMRLQYGEGPYCSQIMQEKFYQGMLQVYKNFPNVQLIIKTKRSENLLVYQEVETLKYFQTTKLDRVIMLDSDADPYVAIEKADLVISTPYTSPSLLALSFGVPGLFYDPTQIANHTYLNAFKPLTLYTEEELFKAVSKMLSGDFEEFKLKHDQEKFPTILPEEVKTRLRQRLG